MQISRDCQELELFIGEQLAFLLYLEHLQCFVVCVVSEHLLHLHDKLDIYKILMFVLFLSTSCIYMISWTSAVFSEYLFTKMINIQFYCMVSC
jgi:hypothetical protein